MDRYITERTALIATGAPGLASARRLAALTDDALRRLASLSPAAPAGRWALVALGGYGSGALLPSSDIDLLVLSDASGAALKPFVESLLYPLWDAGLDLGHQVRSPKEHFASARDDETVRTATLTARVIAGDAAYGVDTIGRCLADAHKRSNRVLAALARRQRPGSPYLLEPDLKDGAGGRRDYDELGWTAAVLTGRPQTTPWSLLEAGVLAGWELGLVEAASAHVAAARWELAALGSSARLSLDSASAIATDAQALQVALADTANVLVRARRRIAGAEPLAVAGEALPGAPLGGDAVLGLLHQGDRGLAELEEAAWLGRLDALVPGYRELLCLRRPALTHELTVGAHSLRCASIAASPSLDGHSVLARSRASISDDRPLLVAALTHDRAKIDSGADHPGRGAKDAGRVAVTFGLDGASQASVSDLVRLHLELPRSALGEDLDSEEVVLAIASRIGREELLAPLHVLTVADSLATGPAAWGPWQDALLSTLVSRLDAALSPATDGAGLASRGEAVRQATLSAFGPDTDSAVRGFVAHAPLRYLASREPAQVSQHAHLVAALEMHAPSAPAKLAVRPGPHDGTYEAAVAAHDRPQLLARITGALSLAGLDILAVDAHTATSGVALDVFTVRSATLAPIEHETWQRAERYLEAALRDRLELETRLKERQRHYSAPSAAKHTEVRIDTSAGYDTALVVTADDRIGLLYDITRAIASVGLDIRWAKAVTAGGVARDTFHVVGADGQAPTDAGVLGHLAMRIREVV
jgi:[protein-PII] uridylyltransferase